VLKGSYVMFPAASAPPMLFTLVLLNGLSAVSLNMFLPSLSNIAADFQAGYGLLASASIAGYAGMTTVLQLLIGPLSDRVGRRPVILVSLVIFVLASLGCLLARDVWTFLLFRTMQAAIVSGFVLSRVIIRDTEPAQKAASLMGYLSIAWAIVPMLSPMLGGAFDQLFGWRANFWAFLGFGAGVLALCWIDLGETNKIPSDTFTKQFKAFPSLFRSRRFWGYSLCMAFSMGALYAFLAAAPLVATAVFQMSPATLGFYMGSTAAGFILGTRFASRRNRARSLFVWLLCVSRLRQRGIDAEQQCRCDVSPARIDRKRRRAVRSAHRRGRGSDGRDHRHYPARSQRSIRPARDDASVVDDGVACRVVRALARPS
jgi:DHA1 family bicyclomycin/chloramphenicol resistance-like MFS transporter